MISQDDLTRTAMYQKNAKRNQHQLVFINYEDYLKLFERKEKYRALD